MVNIGTWTETKNLCCTNVVKSTLLPTFPSKSPRVVKICFRVGLSLIQLIHIYIKAFVRNLWYDLKVNNFQWVMVAINFFMCSVVISLRVKLIYVCARFVCFNNNTLPNNLISPLQPASQSLICPTKCIDSWPCKSAFVCLVGQTKKSSAMVICSPPMRGE